MSPSALPYRPHNHDACVAQALTEAAAGANIYPDPLQREVRAALAAYIGAAPERVVAGAGCDELILWPAVTHLDQVERLTELI